MTHEPVIKKKPAPEVDAVPDVEAVLDAVRELARTELEFTGELALETRLVEDLELDSIRLLTLATAVEDHFRICLDEDDETSIHTAGDLVSRIRAKLHAPPATTTSSHA
ncbi:MAG: acyl carrier protein [Acidobacteriota bacterium]